MEEVVLSAKQRELVGKQVKALRREGRLPAVIYGRGLRPFAITLDAHQASRILPSITSSHLVVVDVEGVRHTSLVREKQHHPVTGALLHIDFQEVSLTEKLRTNVLLELTGESPAVKLYNGVLVTGQEELEVESLPQNLPERVMVNVSGLKEIGDVIHVRDLDLGPDVVVLTNPDEMVVLVTAPVIEIEPEEEAVAEPEVIERGKKEEEEE